MSPHGRAIAGMLPILPILIATALFAGCFDRTNRIVILARHSAPPELPQHRALVYVAQLLRERSDGRIVLDVRPNIAVPNQLDLILEGEMEISMSGLGGLATFYPPLAAFEAPYMFRDLDHFYNTVESPIGQSALAEFERKSRLHIIDVWHQGTRQVTLRDHPATTPEEFGRIRLRIPSTTMYVEMAKVLGALPTTMAFNNVYIGLRAGMVDGQENPLPTIRAMRFNEVCRYLVLTSHMIGTIMPVIGSEQWQSFSPEDRRLIATAFREGREFNRRIIADEETRLVKEFEDGGMIVIRPDTSLFRRRAEQSWRRFTELWGDSLVARIQAVR